MNLPHDVFEAQHKCAGIVCLTLPAHPFPGVWLCYSLRMASNAVVRSSSHCRIDSAAASSSC